MLLAVLEGMGPHALSGGLPIGTFLGIFLFARRYLVLLRTRPVGLEHRCHSIAGWGELVAGGEKSSLHTTGGAK